MVAKILKVVFKSVGFLGLIAGIIFKIGIFKIFGVFFLLELFYF